LPMDTKKTAQNQNSGRFSICSASRRSAHTLYLVRCFLPDLTECQTTSRADRFDAELRRGWDSNPRYGVNRIHGFQPCAIVHSATSPNEARLRVNALRKIHKEGVGFEPTLPHNGKSDFESDAFDRSAIPPSTFPRLLNVALANTTKEASQDLSTFLSKDVFNHLNPVVQSIVLQ